jgi:RND family efflux transporter MFP subunit
MRSLVTTLFAFATACGRPEPPPAAPAAAAPPTDVATAVVVRTDATSEVAAPGVVRARRRATLAARLPASVTELPFDEGERVKAGEIVVRLDDAALRAAVAAAEAGMDAAQAELDRTKTLLARGAATPRELQQATAAAGGARAQLSAAQDGLAYAVLRAPFAGRVAARRVHVGDVVGPGLPLLEIEGEGGLELAATVEAALVERLRPGTRLEALVDGQPSRLAATVTAIAPSGDAHTHRFELKADLPPAPGLRAGSFARLFVPAAGSEPRLHVPASALFERGGLTGLFVVEGGRAHLRWVAAGPREGPVVEVRAGVEAGEEVVLQPLELADGAPVRTAARE